MVRMIKKIVTQFLIIMMLGISFGQITFAEKADAGVPEGFEWVAGHERLSMYADFTTGEFLVVNRESGFIWWSNPPDRSKDKKAQGIWKMSMSSQLLIVYTDSVQNFTANSFTGSLKKKGLGVKRIQDGISVTYSFPKEEISIPVHYRITDDSIKVEIITSGIKEGQKMKLLNIGLLPYFGAGGESDDGYLMVPDGSGAIINFNNNKGNYVEYSQPVYGEDYSLFTQFKKVNIQEIRLPVFGMKNGENGFLAIIAKGDGLARINASVSGKKTSYNNIYSEFQYRAEDTVGLNNIESKTIDMFKIGDTVNSGENYEIRYCFLASPKCDYSGMAGRYRKYLTDECGLKSNIINTGYSFFLNVYGSVIKQKSFLGIPFRVAEPLTTYDDCINLVDQLKSQGIKDIVLKYSNCIKDTRGKVPSSFQAENQLGGIKAFKRLSAYAELHGIKIFPNIDFVRYNKSGNGFSTYGDSSKTINNVASKQAAFKLSTLIKNNDIKPWCLLSPTRVLDAVKNFFKSVEKSGLHGISLDTIGKQVHSDFGRRETNRIAAVEAWKNVLTFIEKQSCATMVSDANAYTFPYAGYITDVPVTSSNFDIEDEAIPFYQMVLHGLIQYSCPPINLASNPDQMFLKAMETGSSLQYSWIWRDNALLKETNQDSLYSVGYKASIDSAVEKYSQAAAIMTELAKKRITGHRKLGENVYETIYENGAKIIVNYSDSPVNVLGNKVKPCSYLFIANE